MNKYIAYFRVSTAKQGQSGLGLEGQKAAVKNFTDNCDNCILAEYTEVETGTNKKTRPEFEKAKAHAIREGATLLIAKLDRLARNVRFVSELMESKVSFKACDMPEADSFTIHIFAALAEREAKMISDRTKAALTAKRQRDGEWRVSGLTQAARQKGADAMRAKGANNENKKRATGYAKALKGQGLTLRAIAAILNKEGFKTSRGKEFQATQVMRLTQ